MIRLKFINTIGAYSANHVYCCHPGPGHLLNKRYLEPTHDRKQETDYNKCGFSVYTVRIYMKCTHVCAAQTFYEFFTKLKLEPDFSCLPDEIAEPRPDINIKVSTFTENEKSSNIFTSDTIHRYQCENPFII